MRLSPRPSLLTILAIGLPIYFVPAIVAFARGHHNKIAIALLNALLGWTAIGWIASLVWSATKVERTA